MKAVAEINGWRKIVEISEYNYKSKILEIMITKPLSHIVPEQKIIKEDIVGITVRLFFIGNYINNLMVFEDQ